MIVHAPLGELVVLVEGDPQIVSHSFLRVAGGYSAAVDPHGLQCIGGIGHVVSSAHSWKFSPYTVYA